MIFQGNFMNGLWMAFIGWFLQNAAASAYAQLNVQETLSGVRVAQVMSKECTRVTSLTPLSILVEEQILSAGQRCFYIADNGKLNGMLTLRDIANVPRQRWGLTTAQQAMVPYDRLVKVDPETDLLVALQIMDNANINQIPIVKDDLLMGTLSRDQVLHYLRTRAELGI
jgi:predicted transcriptional regulator